jgi:hypothetical protein
MFNAIDVLADILPEGWECWTSPRFFAPTET